MRPPPLLAAAVVLVNLIGVSLTQAAFSKPSALLGGAAADEERVLRGGGVSGAYDLCGFKVRLSDDYSDGWQGNELAITSAGATLEEFTQVGTVNPQIFDFCLPCGTCVFGQTGGGSYVGETSWAAYDASTTWADPLFEGAGAQSVGFCTAACLTTVCEEGTQPNAQDDGCYECPRGMFSGSSSSSPCEPCEAGSFAPTSGSASCESCPAGETNNEGSSFSCFESNSCKTLTVEGCANTNAEYYVKGDFRDLSTSEMECVGVSGRVFEKYISALTSVYMYAYPPYWVLGTSCGDPAGSVSTYAYAEFTSNHPLEGTPSAWECKNGGGFEAHSLDISCMKWPCTSNLDNPDLANPNH
jgi:hypothetical protein